MVSNHTKSFECPRASGHLLEVPTGPEALKDLHVVGNHALSRRRGLAVWEDNLATTGSPSSLLYGQLIARGSLLYSH